MQKTGSHDDKLSIINKHSKFKRKRAMYATWNEMEGSDSEKDSDN